MNTKPEEISNVIKEQIKNYKAKIEMKETGTVILIRVQDNQLAILQPLSLHRRS